MSSGDITCGSCEATIDVGADVCPECGARTDVVSSMQAAAVRATDDETGATTECPDCGAVVAAQAVRCPDCFAGLASGGAAEDRPSLAGHGDVSGPSAGNWHVAVAALLLVGAVGLVLTLALPESAGGAGSAGGWLLLVNIVGVPLATYLDIRRLNAAAGWEPQTAVWVGLGVVPGVNVASGFLYLVCRNDAAVAGAS